MTPTPAAAEPSVADLRAMLEPAAPATEPVPETSEPAKVEAPAAEENHEAAAEPAETKQEPVEEPLPEGVQKRIAKEAERAARAQAEINRAISERKAKEAELAKITEADRGPDPDNKPQSAEGSKKPVFGEKGHENEDWDAFEDRKTAYIKAEALREFEERQAAKAGETRVQERMAAATAKHGKEFPGYVEAVCAVAPVDMQRAIGALEHWDTLTAHLAKNEAQLRELVTDFKANPYEAQIRLGRIRDGLVSKAPKAAVTPPLPEPLAKVGGNASASGKDLQSALETSSMSGFKQLVNKARGR